MRVVDDLANEVELAVGKLAPGLVRIFHGALHSVAESKLAREANRDPAVAQRVVVFPQVIDDLAAIVGRQLPLNIRLEAKSFPEIITRLNRFAHCVINLVRVYPEERCDEGVGVFPNSVATKRLFSI